MRPKGGIQPIHYQTIFQGFAGANTNLQLDFLKLFYLFSTYALSTWTQGHGNG